jgi:hypothetical protein
MRRVAVCIPARDTIEVPTAISICAMVGQFTVDFVATGECSIRYYYMNGTLLHDMRNGLVRQALADGATHLLWVDSDMAFPKDTLHRLLKHDAPIVGANYPQRKRPCKPTAAKWTEDGRRVWMYTPPASVGLPDTEVAESMGMGLCLVEAAVYECTPEPWYSMPWLPSTGEHMGEDVWFFRQVKKHIDVEPLVDHALSREVEHVGVHHYVWQDAYDDFDEVNAAAQPKEAAE